MWIGWRYRTGSGWAEQDQLTIIIGQVWDVVERRRGERWDGEVAVLDRYGRHGTGGICSVGQVMEQDRLAIWDSFGCNGTSGVGMQYWTSMDVMEQEEFSVLDRFERERTGTNDIIGQAWTRWNRINGQYRTGVGVVEQDQWAVSDRCGRGGTGSVGNIGQVWA